MQVVSAHTKVERKTSEELTVELWNYISHGIQWRKEGY